LLFFLSKKDEQMLKYVFVNDFADIAFVKINGKLLQLQLQKHDTEKSLYSYFNNSLNVVIELTKSVASTEEEASDVEGL
jgi:uncharacterized membrane protein (UPF0127 family)